MHLSVTDDGPGLSCGVNTKRPETVWKMKEDSCTLWYGAIQQPDTMSGSMEEHLHWKTAKVMAQRLLLLPNKSETLSVF